MSAQNIKSICCLMLAMFSSLALANDGTEGSMKKPAKGEPWAVTKAPCHALISRYIDWHGIATALGQEIADKEYQWLKDTGLLNEEGVNEFHETYVKPEQQIASFDSVAASCDGNPLSDQFSGQLIINSTLINGESMTRTFLQQGPDAYSISGQPSSTSTDEFSALPKTYLAQLPFIKAYYQQRIDPLNNNEPSGLKFTEDVVDLSFNWPTDILMTSVSEMTSEYTRNGNLKKFASTTTYKVELTESDAGVRLSSIYVGLPTYTPPIPEEELKAGFQERMAWCGEESGKMDICWQRTFATVPYHYAINQEGDISQPIIDDHYLSQLEKILQAQYGSYDNYEDFAAKMVDQLERTDEHWIMDSIFRPFERDLKILHGKTLEKGKKYTEFAAPLHFTSSGHSHSGIYVQGNERSLEYLGKKPCHANDNDNACAHITYQSGKIDPKQGAIVVELAMDILLEPHSLILHKIDYEYLKTEFTSEDQSDLKTKQLYKIAIDNKYEDLPK